MARQNLENNVPFGEQRDKINENFEEVYGLANNAQGTADNALASADMASNEAGQAMTAAQGKQTPITLTTTGSSGAATFNQGTGALNIPNYSTGGGGSGDFESITGSPYDNENLGEALNRKEDKFTSQQPIYTGLNNKIVADGNSNGIGYNADIAYPSQASNDLGGNSAGYELVNKSVSGKTTQNMIALAPTEVDPLYDSSKTKNYLFAWEVENDAVINTGLSAADLASNMNAYWASRKALGFIVIAGTSLLRDLSITLRKRINDANAILRSNTSSSNYFIDFEKNPWLSNNRSIVGFQEDIVHLNNSGQKAMAEEFANKVRLDQGQDLYVPSRNTFWSGNNVDRSMVLGALNRFAVGLITDGKVRFDISPTGVVSFCSDVEAVGNGTLIGVEIRPTFNTKEFNPNKYDVRINANSQWIDSEGNKILFFNKNQYTNNFGIGNNILSGIKPDQTAKAANTVVGSNLMNSPNIGSVNTVVGMAGDLSISGSENVWMGYDSTGGRDLSCKNAVMIGRDNNASSDFQIMLGTYNNSTKKRSIIFGYQNTATGGTDDYGSVLIGKNLKDNGYRSVIIGNCNDFDSSGTEATADGQFILGEAYDGGGTKSLTWFSFGGNETFNQDTANSFVPKTITVAGMKAGNVNASTDKNIMRIAGSIATGNARGADVRIAVSEQGVSGSQRQSLVDVVTVTPEKRVGINTTSPTSVIQAVGLLEYADNAAATAAGLTIGAFYRTGDLLKVVH